MARHSQVATATASEFRIVMSQGGRAGRGGTHHNTKATRKNRRGRNDAGKATAKASSHPRRPIRVASSASVSSGMHDARPTDRPRLPPGQIETRKWPVLHY